MRGHSIPDRNRTPSDFISVMPRFHLALGKIYPPQAISFFSRLPQKICFAKILREEERPAVKRVKVCLRTFTAKRLSRDESGERSSKMRRNIFLVHEFEFFAAYNNGTLIRCAHFS